MKEYSIIATVGLPNQGNWQKKTSYVRVTSISANNSKQALSQYKMDKYDTSLGYIIHSAYILPHRLTITIPTWILTIANLFRFNKKTGLSPTKKTTL